MDCSLRKKAAVHLAAACAISILLLHNAAAQGNAARAVADAYNASGQDLFEQFSATPGNIVFSPYSIGTAMAMALSGARGGTEREMLSVLKHRLTREEIDAANGGIMATLNGYDRSAAPPTCPAGTTLNGTRCECPTPPRAGERCSAGAAILAPTAKLLAANALMLTKGGDLVSQEYAARLKDKYAAEIFQNAALADINGWVNRKTEGKIDKILEKLESLTAAVLLNAVYFKSRWEAPFNERLTKDESFSLARSRQVRLPMMNRTGTYALAARPGYRALRLPYAVRELAMVIVLPDEVEGLAEVSRRIDAKELAEMLAALRGAPIPVELALPRFKAEYRADLIPPFRQAGLKLALDDERADFSGITGRPTPPTELYISQIVHRAVIEVSEESTEAAAVTAIEAARPASAAPPPRQPEAFRVDRPFQFYVVDDVTGAILFEGRIADPRQQARAG
jgi:leukocyte elastase inhibitor